MSLWWIRKEQLDKEQLAIIEDLPLRQSCLVLGPPGSGKSNVLVRRAQFVRSQDMPNVLVLAFTRSLVEFMKTGCVSQGREIFPRTCVTTIESWARTLHHKNGVPLPDDEDDLIEWKRQLARSALGLQKKGYLPKYDALFIDEAQDLLTEEVALLKQWSDVLFLVGDDRQKLYPEAEGLDAVRSALSLTERNLPFHYRLAPEICRVADRILMPQGGGSLEESSQYNGPTPGKVEWFGPKPRAVQLGAAAKTLKGQMRVYDGMIKEGDRLGVIVARTDDRDAVLAHFEADSELSGKAKVIRARDLDDDDYDPSFDQAIPICILTVNACKGLEFRTVHWLFCEELRQYHDNAIYYTVVTRVKTSFSLYYSTKLPQALAGAYSSDDEELW